MPRKRQIPVLLDPEQLAEIERIREERRTGAMCPPYAVVIRELVAAGLRVTRA